MIDNTMEWITRHFLTIYFAQAITGFAIGLALPWLKWFGIV
jgi:hypothetical protein